MRQGGLWVIVALAVGCTDPAGRPGRGDDAGSAGGKADDAGSLEGLGHREAVLTCEHWAQTARSRVGGPTDQLQAELDRRDCLSTVNDLVLPELDDAAVALELETSAGSALSEVRASSSWLCGAFVAASEQPHGIEADIAVATCEANMERFVADLVDRHVDLGVEPFFIAQAWRRYGACYDTVQDIPTDDPKTALAEQIESFEALGQCISAVDAELSDPLGERIAAAFDDDAQYVADLIEGELEHNAGRFGALCTVLAAASPEAGRPQMQLHQVHCTSTALELRGRLLGAMTGLQPDGAVVPSPNDPGQPEPTPDEPMPLPPEQPMPSPDGEVCYPGADDSWTTCLPLVSLQELMDGGYDYPAGFGGNPHYRPPIAFLDLDAIDLDTRLSADFTLGELAQRHKGRYAIVQPHAVASLQALRDEVGGLHVNSGYRSPQYNDSVGGATFSRHMYGDGFDVDPLQVGLSTVENACVAIGGKLVEYGTHVHCDFRFDAVDEAFFGPI